MKKILIFLFCITVVLCLSKSSEDSIVIPTSAIRYRIIANSNKEEDQEEKKIINKEVEPVFQDILLNSKTIDESREKIQANIPRIENIVSKYKKDFSVNYGMNYFPEKEYKNVTYKAGNYESLVITLGDGLGDNWWCVLFPPLCLLEAKETELDDITYTSYIKEIINRFI